MSAENKYDDEPRLPTFEEALTEERLLRERSQLMEATKQLAHLRLEMEEKVRREMEEKIRREMEEKMRMEVTRMEEERKKEEERRQLEAMKTERHEKVLAEIQRVASHPGYQTEAHKFRAMTEFVKTHKALMYRYEYHSNYTIALYLSDKLVGLHITCSDHTNVNIQEIRPFYWFDSELTRRDLMIWDNLELPDDSQWKRNNNVGRLHSDISRRKWFLPYVVRSLFEVYSSMSHPNISDCVMGIHVTHLKDAFANKQTVSDFQTILRLIPGGYKNGPWRPLDGFFGPYLNEDTLEIISLIPEAL